MIIWTDDEGYTVALNLAQAQIVTYWPPSLAKPAKLSALMQGAANSYTWSGRTAEVGIAAIRAACEGR